MSCLCAIVFPVSQLCALLFKIFNVILTSGRKEKIYIDKGMFPRGQYDNEELGNEFTVALQILGGLKIL